MTKELVEKIKTITELQAVSSDENEVRNYLKKALTPYVDEIQTDGLGGIFGIKRCKDKNAPTIMVAAHMDEVGFMISEITENGFFRVQAIGGWNPYVIQAQRFTVITRKGDKYPVISSSIPPHLLRGENGQKTPEISDILFDGGFENADEVRQFGIEKGDFLIPETSAILCANQKNMIAKAWDNRYGILMVTEAVKALENCELKVNLVIGANVQEEVGLRGAKVSTHQFNPDLFIAVDCSPADDLNKKNGNGMIGNGPILRLYDPGHILLQGFKNFLFDIIDNEAIPYQYYIGKGGTDAGAAHLCLDGVPSTTIGVVARYIHSHQTIFNLSDFENAQKLLLSTLKKLNANQIENIKKY